MASISPAVIRVHTLTEETGDDATTALDLLTAVDGPLVRVTADAAYDTVAVYETAAGAGCDGGHPTGEDGERLWARPAVACAGSDDHVGEDARPAPVEAGVRVPSSGAGWRIRSSDTRSIIGDGLRARSPAGQGSEAVLGCEILNRMTALGRPVSYRIGR